MIFKGEHKMDLKSVSDGGRVRIAVNGDLDEVGARRLEAHLGQLKTDSGQEVVLDFRNVTYIGSAGVGVLLLLYKRLALNKGRVVIENTPKEIYSLLADGMNLGRVLTMTSA